MSTDKTELVDQAIAALMEVPGDDDSYAKGVSALFQLASILGDKWLTEFDIDPETSEFLDHAEVLKRKNENIANVTHMKNAMKILTDELITAAIFPDRTKRTNKTIYHSFYMGMAFAYLNPDFVFEHDHIHRGRKNKATRQKVQAETVAKITAWHATAKDAYHQVRANSPKLKSAQQISDTINASYKIPGMTPGALYDLVRQWQKEAVNEEPVT